MDTETLQVLRSRGFGEYLGFEVDKIIERDGIEIFNSHPINKDFEMFKEMHECLFGETDKWQP